MYLDELAFYIKHAWFNFKEQFSDVLSSLLSFALVPFFVWILTKVWMRFNSNGSEFNSNEIVVYISLTEILFLSFVRLPSIGRATGDFSLAVARPRSWPLFSFSGLFGRSFGSRVLMLIFIVPFLFIFGVSWDDLFSSILRFIFFLPILGLLQGLFALFFSCSQLLWHQVNYFLLPFGKIFLILGGVWGPLTDYSPRWKNLLISLPPSDLFFQPVYFCIRGNFYQMSCYQWGLRIFIISIVLILLNAVFYNFARSKHQSFGG